MGGEAGTSLSVVDLLPLPRKIRAYVKVFAMIIWVQICLVYYTLQIPFTKPHPSLLNHFTYTFGVGVLKIIGLRIQYQDIEYMRTQPCVLVCNHQSGQDVVSFASAGRELGLNDITAVFKKEVGWIPMIGWLIRASAGILIDRQNRKRAVDSCKVAAECIKEHGWSLIIAAEGTRYCETDTLKPLKKGFAHIAIEAGVPVVPLVQSSLRHKAVWEKLELGGGTVQVKALAPIETKHLTTDDVDNLVAEVQQKMQQAFDELNTQQRAADAAKSGAKSSKQD